LEEVKLSKLIINNKEYSSSLILGTGKYKDFDETKYAVEASGCEMVTVAIRRMNIGQDNNSKSLLDYVSPDKYTILPNTAGCYTAEDAVRTCEIAAELLNGEKLVKLEVLSKVKRFFQIL
jgi:thiazole synthase